MFRLTVTVALSIACFALNSTAGLAENLHRERHGTSSTDRRDWRAQWHRGHWHHGSHHSRFGWWWVIGPRWYFYPQPTYPYPPEIVVIPAPSPVPVPPAPPSVSATPAPYCREFQGDAIINGTDQRFYGTACLEPDGVWHIVRGNAG